MKSILGLGLILSTTLVSAAEIKVMDLPSSGFHFNVMTEFAVNTKANRAWVEATSSMSIGDSDIRSLLRAKVDGLSYEAQTKSVLLQIDGETVTCGKVVRVGLPVFKATRVKPTGACKFEVRESSVIEDNGYETARRMKREIFIVTK